MIEVTFKKMFLLHAVSNKLLLSVANKPQQDIAECVRSSSKMIAA